MTNDLVRNLSRLVSLWLCRASYLLLKWNWLNQKLLLLFLRKESKERSRNLYCQTTKLKWSRQIYPKTIALVAMRECWLNCRKSLKASNANIAAAETFKTDSIIKAFANFELGVLNQSSKHKHSFECFQQKWTW